MESTTLALQREQFYAQRRHWLFKFHWSNRLVTPTWIKGTPYEFIYADAPELLERGTVVWACIVQANTALFSLGPDDHPAQVLFGVDEYSNNLDVLKTYAENVYELMTTKQSPLPTFINGLSSPTQPAFNKKLPSSIAPNHKVCFTSTIIHRKYLPGHKLQASWYPMLINPTSTDASIVLPSRYWLPSVIDAWKNYKDWSPQ